MRVGKLALRMLFLAVLVIRAPAQEKDYVHIEPATKIQPRVIAQVTVDPSTGAYRYAYIVASGPASQQGVVELRLRTRAPVVGRVNSPPGWVGSMGLAPGASEGGPIDWTKTDITWIATRVVYLIRPGQSLAGFEATSPGPPGIVTAALCGDVPAFRPTRQGVVYITDRLPYEQNHVPIPTVGPVPPEELPQSQLDRAVRVKELLGRAMELGWVGGPGRSLQAKLEQACADYDRGNPDKAAKNLQAFLRELEAQRGKHVSQEAYYLLKLNVEQLLSGP